MGFHLISPAKILAEGKFLYLMLLITSLCEFNVSTEPFLHQIEVIV